MFTDEQKQIIDGSLLGDATIWTKRKHDDFLYQLSRAIIEESKEVLQDNDVREVFANSFKTPNKKFCKTQSKLDHKGRDKQSYMDWHMRAFGDLSSSVKPMSFKGVGGKTYHRYTFTTRMGSIWNEVDERWYRVELVDRRVERTKFVPQDLKLTPLSLCVWHMDDGSNNAKDANIEINTHCFTTQEVEFLIERLRHDLGIQAHKKVSGKRKDQFKVYIGRKSYFDFMEMIKPHVQWDCFQYKIDTSGYTKKPHRGETHSAAKLTETKVKQIFSFRDKGWSQKKIATKVGISTPNVSLVLSGDRWAHLGMKRDATKKPRLTKAQQAEIVAMNEKGLLQKEIAEQLNTTQSTVSRVLRKNDELLVKTT